MVEKSSLGSRDQANRWQKLGLVWRNIKKISQIINANLFLPFFLVIILWRRGRRLRGGKGGREGREGRERNGKG
jgi:hypothetical protein